MNQIRLIAIRDTALSVDEVRNAIADPAAGGEVLFIGTVRDHDAEKGVTGLGYSAHPSAEAELRKVTGDIVAKFPDVIGVAAVHRTGDLAVGDLAVVVGVSCAHRAEAFHACHELIDELAAAGMVVGDFAVGCDGSLSQAEVESLSGLKSVELPARLTFSAAQRLHRLGVTPAPAVELRYMVYPWVVDCAKLRAADWRPAFSNTEALSVLLAGRAGHHAAVGRRPLRLCGTRGRGTKAKKCLRS